MEDIKNINIFDLVGHFIHHTPVKTFDNKKFVMKSLNIDNNVDSMGIEGHCVINVEFFCPEDNKNYHGALFKKANSPQHEYSIRFNAALPIEEIAFYNPVLEATDTTLATRDYFAGQALSALISGEYEEPAKNAYLLAEEMIKEKKKYEKIHNRNE